MERILVESSNINSIGYDEENSILEIEFHGGEVYQYFDVPKEIHQGLMNADSYGKFHHDVIKDNFRYKRAC